MIMLDLIWGHLELVNDGDAHFVIRSFFIFATAVILAVRLLPPLRHRFLSYGPRSTLPSRNELKPNLTLPSSIEQLLDFTALLTVPHSWFFHFYLISVSISCLSLRRLLSLDVLGWSTHSAQSLLPLILMTIQGLRRLIECLSFTKSSPSRMWIGHYILGLAFYIALNVTLNLEARHSLDLQPPEWRTTHVLAKLGALLIFVRRSYQQHIVHRYLAVELKKYSVPDHPLFSRRQLIAPHYSAECDIYGALACLTARHGHLLNLTMACAWIFVIVNLGLTAEGTKTWLLLRFPDRRQDIVARYLLFSPSWFVKL